MVYYVSNENFSSTIEKIIGKTFWVPIQSDPDKHYIENRISSIYIYSFLTGDEYIIGFHSNDLDRVGQKLFQVLADSDKIVYNSKYLDKHLNQYSDADLMVWYYTGHPIEVPESSKKIFKFYRGKYRGIENINDVIPIMRILEYCRDIRNQFIQHYNDQAHDHGFDFYERVYLKNLIRMESSGICVDDERYYHMTKHVMHGNLVYADYNPFTMTGRPSNTSSGINFNALNKDDGSREIIVSRFDGGRLFEFDYDSYHIRLIAKLIGFVLPDGNLHEYFARQYFGNVDITDELYEQSKRLTFRQIYGAILPEYAHIPFYAAVQAHIDSLWSEAESNGFFYSPISKRKFYLDWYSDMNKMKMFSYIIQAMETEVNMMVLDKILQYLYQVKSKLVLYTYDAILIDYDPTDGGKVLKDIQNIMMMFNNPVKIKAGVNYNDMVPAKLY